MSLVVSGKSELPIWMEPQNGNSSDKTAFHETIRKVRAFQKQLQSCPDFKWVADSALYRGAAPARCKKKVLRHPPLHRHPPRKRRIQEKDAKRIHTFIS